MTNHRPKEYDANDPATWNLENNKNSDKKVTDNQPNKPDSEGKNIDERQAVKNQSSVKPEDYPKDDGGRPNYRTNKP